MQFEAPCVEFGSVAQVQHCPYVETVAPPPKAKHHNRTKVHGNETRLHHNKTHTNETKKHHGECPKNLKCPTECGWKCGCEIVEGLRHRKDKLQKLSAHVNFIASAMLHFRNLSLVEHHKNSTTNATNVTRPHTDDPKHKRFGLTRMEWDFVRSCHKRFQKYTPAEHEQGLKIHRDREWEIEAYQECERHYTSRREFLAGLRDGIKGIDHPNIRDAVCFREAHEWVADHLERGHHLHDDVRFFVHLPEPADEIRSSNRTKISHNKTRITTEHNLDD